MPEVLGRSIPTSVNAVTRSQNQTRIRLLINSPTSDPDLYTYGIKEITVGQNMRTRRMVQKGNPDIYYEFTFPPTQIAYEGMGVEITEIPRPLQRPLIDIKASKNYKAVFEFLVASQYDGLSTSVEEELRFLELMSNMAEPVYFENFDVFLTNGFWYIAEFAVKTSRVNTDGEIVAAQCSISLLEYQDTNTKFVKFPKLRYSPTVSRKKASDKDSTDDDGERIDKTFNVGASKITAISQAAGTQSETQNGMNTRIYRWRRTKEPDRQVTGEKSWVKEGKYWYLYSTTNKFPYDSLYNKPDTLNAAAFVFENLTAAQKVAYKKSTLATKASGKKLPPAKQVMPYASASDVLGKK